MAAKTDIAGRRIATKGEPKLAMYADKDIPPVIQEFVEYLKAETGVDVDARSIYLGSSLRGAFQKSEGNQKRITERSTEIEQEKLDRAQAVKDRAERKVAKEAERKEKAAAKVVADKEAAIAAKADVAATKVAAAEAKAAAKAAPKAPATKAPTKAAAAKAAAKPATPTRRRAAKPAAAEAVEEF